MAFNPLTPLGLPKLGVDGKVKGSVDYLAFLLRFKPVHANIRHDEARMSM
jgi:hypothetical protein